MSDMTMNFNLTQFGIDNPDLVKRFMEKDIKQNGTCIEWGGCVNKGGYGNISYMDKINYSHRIAYMIFCGEIPDGLCVCHSCDNRKCVNPDHLWLGTYGDNLRDMIKKGRGWLQVSPEKGFFSTPKGKEWQREYFRKKMEAKALINYEAMQK